MSNIPAPASRTSPEPVDTIAAIATPPGEGGISIVRVSGPLSLPIADRVFRCGGGAPSARAGGSFVHGVIRSSGPECRSVDEAVLLVFRAPHSYTREDVVEFQGHGGYTAARRILEAVLGAGARPAEPGEFTRRAFLNGRIDLLQAEAVADLIRARSDRAAQAAVEQLEGRLSRQFETLSEALTGAGADLEASLDFPEDDIPPEIIAGARRRLHEAAAQCAALLETWHEGHVLREGALVVICGRPNVGKSTLLNLLVGRERAIVADQPGTTRDTIEEQVVLGGYPVRLVDTAGLRTTTCTVEQEGVRRANDEIRRADLVIIIIDASQPMTDEDKALIATLDPRRTIIAYNKIDLVNYLYTNAFHQFKSVNCSFITSRGVDELRQILLDLLHVHTHAPSHAVISERHRQIVQNVMNDISHSFSVLDSGHESSVLLAATCVRSAAEHLGRVTGRTYSSDLLDLIFSKFCIGK